MCNTRPLMPAPGGAERVVGNNPIAIAIPTDGPSPDRARHGDERGRHGQDPHGGEGRRSDPGDLGGAGRRQRRPRTPTEAIAGMLLPSGGPKGFGLSFMIDLLCGLLSRRRERRRRSSRSMAIPPCLTTARISSSRSTCAHFGDPATVRGRRRSRGRAHPLRPARARRRAVVHAGRAGMATAREAPPGRCSSSRAVVGMLRRMASELGVVGDPLRGMTRPWRRTATCRNAKSRARAISAAQRHFSQATVIEASGTPRLHLRHDGAPARRHHRRHRRHHRADPAGLREHQSRGRGGGRHARRYLPGRRLCAQHGAFRRDPRRAARNTSSRRCRPRPWSRSPSWCRPTT